MQWLVVRFRFSVKTMQAYKNIFLLDGIDYDSNIYLVDGEILVDTGTGKFFNEIKKEIIDLGVDLPRLKLIVNTHAHFDHVGGNESFKKWLKANILIHRADAGLLERGEVAADLFGLKIGGIKVDRQLEDGDFLKTRHFNFKVIHSPGHTKGSICLYDKSSKILISGDTIFADGVGRTDLPGGDRKEMAASIEKISKLKVKHIFPGHGKMRSSGLGVLFKQLLTRYTK